MSSSLQSYDEDDLESFADDIVEKPVKPKAKFWMLYAEGGAAPSHKHADYMAAMLEAKRIMDQPQWKGARIYVLEATGVIEMQVVKEFIHKEIKYD